MKPKEDHTVPYRKSLSISWKEGIPASMMISLVDYYLIPLALFLGAVPFQIGLLVAIPNFLGSITQLFAVRAVKALGNRLSFLVKGTFSQAAILLPIAALPVVMPPLSVWVLIAIIVFYRIAGNLVGTVWGSLASDYLPPEQRGKYFGWRSQIAGAAGISGLILGGVLLNFFKPVSPAAGFAILFASASALRFLSSWLMSHMEEVPLRHTPESDFTFYMFMRRFRESNFVKFVFFVAAITFSTNLAAPYFSVHLLKNLKVDYLAYMGTHLCSILGGLIAFPIWGRHADHFGNAKILKVTSWLIPAIPVLWILAPNIYCIMLIEACAGFIWGGFNLCSVNYIFDAVVAEKRVRCFSYFSFINGLAIFLGATLGGFLAERLPPIRGYSLFSVFLLSGVLRLFSHFLLSRRFREVRASARKISSSELFFSVVGFRPLLGRNRDWNLVPLFKRSPLEK